MLEIKKDIGTGVIRTREGNVKGVLSRWLISEGRKPDLDQEKEITISLRNKEKTTKRSNLV